MFIGVVNHGSVVIALNYYLSIKSLLFAKFVLNLIQIAFLVCGFETVTKMG